MCKSGSILRKYRNILLWEIFRPRGWKKSAEVIVPPIRAGQSLYKLQRTHERGRTEFLNKFFLGEVYESAESESRLKSKIRRITQRNRGKSLNSTITELSLLLRGWLNYFRPAQMKRRLRGLDSWIRKGLRCCRLKQCKRAKGIHRFLKKLGVSENRCWTRGASRKG